MALAAVVVATATVAPAAAAVSTSSITDWVSVGVAALALLGSAISVALVCRGYRMNQLYRFAQSFEDEAYFTRFWTASIPGRSLLIVIGPYDPPAQLRTFAAPTGLLPPVGKPGRPLSLESDHAWQLAVNDMLGPGFAADRTRADMVTFGALVMRIAYWLGVESGLVPEWMKRRRARQVLRVFGDQLIVTIHRHRTIAAHIVRVDCIGLGECTTESLNYRYYPQAYGLFDSTYKSFLDLLLDASTAREFGAMGEKFEDVQRFEKAVSDHKWPESVEVKSDFL